MNFLFLVAILHQWSFDKKTALLKYILLPFLPCETAKFSRLGVKHPHTPLCFIRTWELTGDKIHAAVLAQ